MEVPDERLVYVALLSFDVHVLESEVGEFILVGTFDVEERVALQGDVAHRHLIGIRLRHLFLSFQVEKLCPRAYQDTTFGIAFHVFHRDVVVMLRSVGTHFQPQDAAGLRDGTTAQDDVVVVDGLAAASQSAVAESVCAVLDDDVAVSAVVRILVGLRAFATFQGYGVVVYRHVATFDQYVGAGIYVHRVATRSFYGSSRSEDVQAQQFYVVAAVEVCGPEGRVDEAYAGELHIVAVRDIYQTRTHLVHVGAFGVPLAAEHFQ